MYPTSRTKSRINVPHELLGVDRIVRPERKVGHYQEKGEWMLTLFFVALLIASVILLKSVLNVHISHTIRKLQKSQVKARSWEQERKCGQEICGTGTKEFLRM